MHFFLVNSDLIKNISQNSGNCKSEIRVPTWSSSGEVPLHGLQITTILLYPQRAEREKERDREGKKICKSKRASSLVCLLTSALIPSWKLHFSYSKYLSKDPSLTITTLGISVSTHEFMEPNMQLTTNINSIQHLRK